MTTILLATDYRACSARAFALAFELAETLGAKVHVVHTFLPPATPGGPSHVSQALDEASDACERAMRKLTLPRRGTPLLGETRVLVGAPATALKRAVDTLHPDLVVIGRHRCGAERSRLGRVAESLIRHGCGQVLVVPAPDADAAKCVPNAFEAQEIAPGSEHPD